MWSGVLAAQSVATSDPGLIKRACHGMIEYLRERYSQREEAWQLLALDWLVVGTSEFANIGDSSATVTLFLHRITRLAELVELHFILSFWASNASAEHSVAGWVMSQLERNPVIPDKFLASYEITADCDLKIRRSDEDARQVWQMITDEPLRLSLTYVATLSPKQRNRAGLQDAQ